MAPVTPEIALVFALILAALAAFASEVVPPDITAIGVMVTLLLVEPVTARLADAGLIEGGLVVLPADYGPVPAGVSGFANAATITVLAMFVLSEGVQRTGVVQRLGARVAGLTGDSEGRQVGATIGLVGPLSGIINNTAAVAILLPMVTDLAHEGDTSPSKLLMPLSYASMVGGTLTLIGTSTNILASEVAVQVAETTDLEFAPLGMFEFTALGAVLLVVGSVYLLTVGRWLTPERVPARSELTKEYDVADYLTEVVVEADSPLVGRTVRDAFRDGQYDLDIVQLVRDGEAFLEPLGPKTVRAGDVFAVRTSRETLVELLAVDGLALSGETVDDAGLERAEDERNLVEVVVAPGSEVAGETMASTNFRQRYDATVLAVRRGGDVIRRRMARLPLRVGDTLLVEAPADSVARLDRSRQFIVAGEVERPDDRRSKTPVAVGIVLGVVALAGVGVLDILTAALAGALAMVVTGCLRPPEVYEAVQWDVIFLLAGVIPLGLAMDATGAAGLVAESLVSVGGAVPPIVVVGLFYVVTALLTNVVSNNAAVVLMIPVALRAATQLGAPPRAYVFAVAFAASTAFMTPIGYQTNLFVYGPGGYRFSDYFRVGAPLQAIMAVVTTVGIAVIWGV